MITVAPASPTLLGENILERSRKHFQWNPNQSEAWPHPFAEYPACCWEPVSVCFWTWRKTRKNIWVYNQPVLGTCSICCFMLADTLEFGVVVMTTLDLRLQESRVLPGNCMSLPKRPFSRARKLRFCLELWPFECHKAIRVRFFRSSTGNSSRKEGFWNFDVGVMMSPGKSEVLAVLFVSPCWWFWSLLACSAIRPAIRHSGLATWSTSTFLPAGYVTDMIYY